MTVERIAHRGAKHELPENTLQAFRRAFQRGADAIELDVHATSDGVVVVHHDPGLRVGLRTVEIAESAWDEVGSVELRPGFTVPRLADVLAETPSHSTAYVEIKGREIESLVADVIHRSSARCAVHSFDHGAIATMRDIASDIPRGILFERDASDLLGVMSRTGARDVWPHWKLVDETLVRTIHDAGGRVIVWTVNDAGLARRLTAIGVDGLCGDDVRVFDSPAR